MQSVTLTLLLLSDLQRLTYKSCEDLKSKGIFVSGLYLIEGSSSPQFCQLWGKGF